MSNSTQAKSSQNSARDVRQAMREQPLLFFFLLAYAISWIVSIPYILSEWGILPGNLEIVFVLKSFGPFLAAFILTGVLEGPAGVQRLRQRIRQKRAGWPWYGFALLGIPALIILGILIQPGRTAGFTGLQPLLLVSYPLTFVAVFFGGGPLGEEPGWRGFALPRLQARFGALGGTLLLGLGWTCWHLPDFLTSAQGGGPGTGWAAFLVNFPIFLVLVMSIAVILTWVYNSTQGSIFMALLAHASVNTPQVVLAPLFPAVDTTSLNLAALLGFGAMALAILLLTRGRLGYLQANSAEPAAQAVL